MPGIIWLMRITRSTTPTPLILKWASAYAAGDATECDHEARHEVATLVVDRLCIAVQAWVDREPRRPDATRLVWLQRRVEHPVEREEEHRENRDAENRVAEARSRRLAGARAPGYLS